MGSKTVRVREILENGRVRLGLAVGGVSAISGLLQGFQSVWDAMTWAVWIYEHANTPWLGVFMLFLVGWLLWSGIKQVEAASANGDQKEMESNARVAQALEKAVKLPMMQVRLHIHRDEVGNLSRIIADAKRRMESIDRDLERYRQGEKFPVDRSPRIPTFADTLGLDGSTFLPKIIRLPDWKPNWKHSGPVIDVEHIENHRKILYFDPSRNATLIRNEDVNRTVLDSRIHQLETLLEKEMNSLNHQERILEEEIKNAGIKQQ